MEGKDEQEEKSRPAQYESHNYARDMVKEVRGDERRRSKTNKDTCW